jgi:hypothetical protein
VPSPTHEALHLQRLFNLIPRFITNTGITIARAYTTYYSLRWCWSPSEYWPE